MEAFQNKDKEVLIIRLSAMGDVAMTIPVIERVRRDNPNVSITILTSKVVMPLFSHIDGINVIGWDLKNDGDFLDIIREFIKLRKYKKFDLVIDLHDIIRTKVIRKLFILSGTKVVKIDKLRKDKKNLLKTKSRDQLKTMVQCYIDTFKRAGLKVKEQEPSLIKRKMPIPKSILASTGEKNSTWIGIAPFAKHQGKAYPTNLIEEVIDHLLSYDKDIFFFIFSGGGQEREMAEVIASRHRQSMTVFGKTLLDGEIKLISNIDCMVTMDSGAMHFASVVGTPVVSVWGATHPSAGFLGYGQDVDNVVQVDMDCRPCSIYGNKPCIKEGEEQYTCMEQIDPIKIADKVIKIINSKNIE